MQVRYGSGGFQDLVASGRLAKAAACPLVHGDRHRLVEGQGDLPASLGRHAHDLEWMGGEISFNDAVRRHPVSEYSQVKTVVVAGGHLFLQLHVEDCVDKL